MIQPLLFIASGVGLGISVYFLLVFYGKLEGDESFVPPFCRMETQRCLLVVHHPDARLLGVPNALPAIAFYLCVALVAVGIGGHPLREIVFWASWVSVAVGAFLVYSLLFRVRVLCPLCLAAHGLNLVIATLLSL